MIKTYLTLLLLATSATCQKKSATLVSAEGEAPAIKVIKTTGIKKYSISHSNFIPGSLLTAIDVSKADLDWEQVTSQQDENKSNREIPKVISEEYLAEKVEQPPR